jgi:predicted NUDIX family NTP pyrophosphohydrolase
MLDLGELKQPSGKRITAWAIKGDSTAGRPPTDLYRWLFGDAGSVASSR